MSGKMEFMSAREVGQRIQTLREAAGIKQPEFARDIGLSSRQLQRIEAGESEISTTKLFEIAAKLQVEPSMFLGAPAPDKITLSDLARNESKILQILEERLPAAGATSEVKNLTAEIDRLNAEIERLNLLMEETKNFENLATYHPKLPAVMRDHFKIALHALRTDTFTKHYEKMPASQRPKIPMTPKPKVSKKSR
jgi:transcriptional regulator with XRE-family HTH domain